MAAVRAVSYTHLDVYKRQVSTNSYKVSREDVVDSAEDVIAWAKSLGDVYKRQN